MYCEPRIDEFQGSQAAYVTYLEAQVNELRKLLRPPTTPINRSAATIPNLSEQTSMQTLENLQEYAQKDCSTGQLEDSKYHKQWIFIDNNRSKNVAKENVYTAVSPWVKEIDAFLSEIPEASRWMDERAALGITSPAQNHSILAILLGHSVVFGNPDSTSCSPRSSSQTDALLGCVEAYACAAKRSQVQAESATKVALFQGLVFASLCVVLQVQRVPEESIDLVMRSYFAATDNAKNLARIRSGALWANRCIGELSENEWGLRSTEIFYLCGRTIRTYGRFSDYTSNSLKYFKKHLADSRYVEPYEEIDGWMPYHIPCIIKVLVGGALSLEEICASLEYPEKSLPTFRSLYEKYERIIGPESENSPAMKKDMLTVEEHYSLILAQTASLKRHLPQAQSRPKRQKKRRCGATVPIPEKASEGDNVSVNNRASGTITTDSEQTSGSIPSGKEACHSTSVPGGQNRNTQEVPQCQELYSEYNVEEPPGNQDIPGVADFDMISMINMGFDMTAMMDMGFDMTSVMELGPSMSTHAVMNFHQDETGELVSRADLPLGVSTSPLFTAAS